MAPVWAAVATQVGPASAKDLGKISSWKSCLWWHYCLGRKFTQAKLHSRWQEKTCIWELSCKFRRIWPTPSKTPIYNKYCRGPQTSSKIGSLPYDVSSWWRMTECRRAVDCSSWHNRCTWGQIVQRDGVVCLKARHRRVSDESPHTLNHAGRWTCRRWRGISATGHLIAAIFFNSAGWANSIASQKQYVCLCVNQAGADHSHCTW